MTQSQSNDSITNDASQQSNLPLGCSKAVTPTQKPAESWQAYQARISQPGYQSPLICDDDTPLTLQEHLQLILNHIDETSPAEPLGKLVVDALKAQPRIADSHDTQPDYSSLLRELIEEVRQTKEIIQSKPGGGNANSR